MTDINEPSLLRALRAEARQNERGRLIEAIDALRVRSLDNAATASRKPGLTGFGRRAAALAWLLDELAHANPYAIDPGEPAIQIESAIDVIEIHGYDPDDEPDEFPVRIVVNDGGDDSVSTAYLTLEEAEQTFAGGLALVERIRQHRADRTAPEAGGDQR